jgi:hypothetical protein
MIKDALLYLSQKQGISKTAQETNAKTIDATTVLEVNGISDKMNLVLMVTTAFAISGNGSFKFNVETGNAADLSDSKVIHHCMFNTSDVNKVGILDQIGLRNVKKYLKVSYQIESGLTITDGAVDCFLSPNGVETGEQAKAILETSEQAKVATPELDTISGVYIGSKTITVTSDTEGATFVYTKDGSTPTAASDVAANGIITLDASCTLRVVALKPGMIDSDVAEAGIVIKCATPAANPDGGNFETSQEITLSCATPDAVIHYTDDNSTPTAASPTYAAAFTITETKTIKAVAIKNNLANSDELVKTFTKTN